MSTPPSDPFSVLLFTQLVHRLRRANARYDQIAYRCRNTYRPTHHAKQRAYRAGLCIDTSIASLLSVPPVLVCTGQDADNKYKEEMQLAIGGLSEAILPKATDEPLSPLDLELGGLIGVGLRGDLPVPGAPRLRQRSLPEDDCRTESEVPSLRRRRYDPVGLGNGTPSQRRRTRKMRKMGG